ncbi:hypothetical protein UPYG_G00086230 [Umbra pygmaea]|uniref:Uncharacterized protein n=1 Tax=Umbra pygmaea TaxID=75934 RepID=A0ABD0XES1_UMBPY
MVVTQNIDTLGPIWTFLLGVYSLILIPSKCVAVIEVSFGYLIVLLVVSMEPARKRKTSPVCEYFDLNSPNKVKCMVCSNTSSMLRHTVPCMRTRRERVVGPAKPTDHCTRSTSPADEASC